MAKRKYVVCGECIHWKRVKRARINGSCLVDLPMWAKIVDLNADQVRADQDASSCDCYMHPDDVPMPAPHYVGYPAPAEYEKPSED